MSGHHEAAAPWGPRLRCYEEVLPWPAGPRGAAGPAVRGTPVPVRAGGNGGTSDPPRCGGAILTDPGPEVPGFVAEPEGPCHSPGRPAGAAAYHPYDIEMSKKLLATRLKTRAAVASWRSQRQRRMPIPPGEERRDSSTVAVSDSRSPGRTGVPSALIHARRPDRACAGKPSPRGHPHRDTAGHPAARDQAAPPGPYGRVHVDGQACGSYRSPNSMISGAHRQSRRQALELHCRPAQVRSRPSPRGPSQ